MHGLSIPLICTPRRLKVFIRAILHDENTYPKPDVFDPTRYLMSDGSLNKDAPRPEDTAFGFGRRRCPGRHLATESMWTVISHILATLKIEKARDASGKILEPSGEYSSGLIRYAPDGVLFETATDSANSTSYPAPFSASFTPRRIASFRAIMEHSAGAD